MTGCIRSTGLVNEWSFFLGHSFSNLVMAPFFSFYFLPSRNGERSCVPEVYFFSFYFLPGSTGERSWVPEISNYYYYYCFNKDFVLLILLFFAGGCILLPRYSCGLMAGDTQRGMLGDIFQWFCSFKMNMTISLWYTALSLNPSFIKLSFVGVGMLWGRPTPHSSAADAAPSLVRSATEAMVDFA